MILIVKVKPGSRETKLRKDSAGNWILKLTAPPVDGKANKSVIEFFADKFSLPKSSVEIISGGSNRIKKIRLSADDRHLLRILNRYL